MALHPALWILMGGAVSIVSFTLGDRFILFFYAGVLFLAWGVLLWMKGVLLQEPVKRYVCYKCKGAVSLGASRCTHCGARLNARHGR